MQCTYSELLHAVGVQLANLSNFMRKKKYFCAKHATYLDIFFTGSIETIPKKNNEDSINMIINRHFFMR